MKKRIWFILALATLLIIVGGVGSVVSFQKLEAERQKSDINKKFKYDNSEELVLNIKNRATLHLSTSEDNYVHMKKQGLSYGNISEEKTTWDIQKEGKQTIVTIDNKNKQQKLQPVFFSFGDIYDDSISLSLPENYKKITIKGHNLDISAYDLTLTKLDVKTKYGNVDANELISEELAIETSYGDTYLNDTRVEKDIKVTSTNGNISVQDTSFTNLIAETNLGDVFTANTKGNLAITNQSGETNINHTKGKVTVDNKNSDIYFHSNNINYDVALNSIHGNIQMEIDKESYNRNKFNLETNFGLISIFNKNLSSETTYSSDKGKNKIQGITKNGDISIYELDEDDTEYGSH